MSESALLQDLAQRVLDGIEIDWAGELDRRPEQHETLERLRLVDQVARTHRWSTLVTTTAGDAAALGPTELPAAALASWGHLFMLEKIGEGGFGEVFRAYDPRLQVEVALKLFRPQHRASAETVLAEARALARMGHLNVLLVHGADERDGRVGMWTQLLRGRTLEQLVTQQGPFSAREATLIGIDLCSALAAVHSTGFVHGDVKTSNVMREQGGRIVLMDFGTVLQAAPPEDGEARGERAGTPIAMAPEQLRGQPPSRAGDLYALGVLLYRLVTSRYPVEAGSLEELRHRHSQNASVPLRDRRPDLPPRFVQIVERAMAASATDRFPSAGEMERALADSLTSAAEGSAPVPIDSEPAPAPRVRPPGPTTRDPGPRESIAPRRRSRWLGAAAVLAFIVGAVGYGPRLLRHPDPEAAPFRFSIAIPRGCRFSGYANSAVAPDGRSVVYAAEDSSGVSRLWLRRFDELEARPLPGTDRAFYPFWSPDSRQVGFFTRGFLKKSSVEGGRTETLCAAPAGRGGSWSRRDLILFAPNVEGPLFQIPATGGQAVQTTSIDSTAGEIAHRWPAWMPDGEHFVYLSLPPSSGRFHLYAGSIDSDRRFDLGTTSSGVTLAREALIYLDDQTLVARPFDESRLRFTGDATAIGDAKRFGGSLGEPHASVSRNGVLVFQNWTSRVNELTWVDRRGSNRTRLASGPFFDPRLSPDGTRIAIERTEGGTNSDVWVMDVATGSLERFTSGPGLDRFPQWSPDGTSIAFASNRGGRYELFERSVQSPVREVRLKTTPEALLKWPTDRSPHGILYTVHASRTGYDVWLRTPGGQCTGLETGSWNEINATLSPDGKRVAFESDESGNPEIYCRQLAGGTVYRLSRVGGTNARWRADGLELFYRTPAGVFYSVSMPPSGGTPRERALFRLADVSSYDVDRTGRRFICCVEGVQSVPSELTVTMNWARWLLAGR